ncbi:TPA: hypothetical protein SLO90_001272 [Citrobacter koseri]|nr:hypothetical protein [Citrobacter koseri]
MMSQGAIALRNVFPVCRANSQIVKERYGMVSAVQRRAVWVVIGFGLFAVDD